MISLILNVAFLYNDNLAFSLCIYDSVYLVHPYSSMDTVTDWNKFRFILSGRLYFHMIYWLSKEGKAFAKRMVTSLSVDEILLRS